MSTVAVKRKPRTQVAESLAKVNSIEVKWVKLNPTCNPRELRGFNYELLLFFSF